MHHLARRILPLRLLCSNVCNLRCDYCHVFDDRRPTPAGGQMSPEVAEAAVASFARTLSPDSDTCVQISFYGGEALANWRLVEHTVGYARDLLGDDRVSFILNTNATLVKERHAQFCRSAGVDVHIGLDGIDAETNRSRRTRTGKPAFDRAARGIEVLAAAGCRTQLNTVLTPANIDNLESLIDWSSARGIDRVYAAVPDLHGAAALTQTEAVARRLWQARAAGRRRGVLFGGPWARAVFSGGAPIIPGRDSSGAIVSLPQVNVDGVGNTYWSPFPDTPIGQVAEGTPGDWFRSTVAAQLLGDWEGRFAKCAACPLVDNCRGYLRALSLYHQGSEEGVERQCELALAVADMSAAAYADPGRLSQGTRLVASGQIVIDDTSPDRITHRLRQETFDVDDQDRALLAHFAGDGQTAASCKASGDLPRIVRLMDQAALLPIDFDEEYEWLEGQLPGDYKPLKGKQCVVFGREGSYPLMQTTAELIDGALDGLGSCIVAPPRQPILVVLADSDAVFSLCWSATSIQDWVTMYTGARRILLLRSRPSAGLPGDPARGSQQLRHELAHFLIGQGRFNLPIWLEEGLCEFIAKGPATEEAWKSIREAPVVRFRDVERMGAETLIDLDRRPPGANPYYLHAWAFVTSLVETLGDGCVQTLLRKTSCGVAFGQACRELLGADLSELENHWRATRGLSVANLELSDNLVVLRGGRRSLMYDKVYGGAIRLDSAVAESILAPERSSEVLGALPDRTLEALFSRGLLRFSSQTARRDAEMRRQVVTNLRLNLTDRCNMRCGYCYVDHDAASRSPMMTEETALRALGEFFRHLAPRQPIDTCVRFFGGEPLLNWPVVEAAMEYIATRAEGERVRMILNTNATNLRASQAERLAANGVEVVVSLDGLKAVHDRQRRLAGGGGSFDKTAAGIECLLEAGCFVGVGVSVYHGNLPHLIELIDWIAGLQQQFGARIPVGLNELSIVDFPVAGDMAVSGIVESIIGAVRHGERQGVDISGSTLLKPWNSLLGRSRVGAYCAAIGREVTVHPDGDISPCMALKTRLGSIKDFPGALGSPAFSQLASRVSGNIAECAGCDIEAYCAGACAADNAGGRAGVQMSMDCSIRRSLFKALVSEFALRAAHC